MKKLIKEPLLHFLFIGASLFILYTLVNEKQIKDEIIIDNAVINDLSSKWQMQWKRTPTTNELSKLVGLYINQEVLYREALEMNLDHNDEIIKRRLAKKMEFISDDLAESLQPSEPLLRNYYEDNKGDYKKSPIYSFTQVYFKDKQKAILALSNNNPENLGNKLSLPSNYVKVDALKISIDFGKAFSQSLDTLALNKWAGPIKSGYGNHLVYITNKTSAGIYSYEEVADKVLIDYNFFTSKEFKKELIKSLLKNYTLTFQLEDGTLKTELSEKY